jgi:L-iditol 2-dehydrogenase
MAVNGAQHVNGMGKSEEVVASVLHGVKDLKIVSCSTS